MATKSREARSTRTEDRPGQTSANYHTHALTRGLVLLELLASAPPPVTLTGMHERTGLPKSTLVRLLAALTEMRFVVRVDERPAYRLGHKVTALADAYVSSVDLSAVAGAYLDELVSETQQTADLGLLDGREVVHVCVRRPDRPLRFETSPGRRDSTHCTGLGKMLLAGVAPDQLAAHVPAEPFPACTERTITSLDGLAKEVRRTRRRGHAVDDNESSAGLRSLAVPVTGNGQRVAALSVSGPAGEFTPKKQKEYLELLHAAADRLAGDPDVVAVLSRAHGPTREP
ncbi:IclR family transcriptional regulator [Actinophytocola glycyrrhizae]|uniref:IclR family transcriptional regulator n=1 Tax=Actinophytocola glycyrrhizae TaxID=2044873 RepID=A0ABV9S0G2_9PSEU